MKEYSAFDGILRTTFKKNETRMLALQVFCAFPLV